MQPHRRRSLAHLDRGKTKCSPFPGASVTTILFVVLLSSMLSALYIGAHRRVRRVGELTTALDVLPSSGSIAGEDRIGDVKGPSIRSLKDLAPSELHPTAGPRRHIVTPPRDESPITLVTCNTTVGYLHVSFDMSQAATSPPPKYCAKIDNRRTHKASLARFFRR